VELLLVVNVEELVAPFVVPVELSEKLEVDTEELVEQLEFEESVAPFDVSVELFEKLEELFEELVDQLESDVSVELFDELAAEELVELFEKLEVDTEELVEPVLFDVSVDQSSEELVEWMKLPVVNVAVVKELFDVLNDQLEQPVQKGAAPDVRKKHKKQNNIAKDINLNNINRYKFKESKKLDIPLEKGTRFISKAHVQRSAHYRHT
jgi:hypothetical protein